MTATTGSLRGGDALPGAMVGLIAVVAGCLAALEFVHRPGIAGAAPGWFWGAIVGLWLFAWFVTARFAAAAPPVDFGRRVLTVLVPVLFGAYVAFLAHAGVDWDWELTAVTATGLLTGCLLLLAARTRSSRAFGTPLRVGVVVVAVAASVAGTVGLLGNSAVAHGRSAIADGDTARAIDEAERAHKLLPWSADPWLVKGEAQLVAGDARGAAQSFRKALDADPRDWRGWHDLAVASTGRTRERALRRALALYPTSSEIERTIAALRRADGGENPPRPPARARTGESRGRCRAGAPACSPPRPPPQRDARGSPASPPRARSPMRS